MSVTKFCVSVTKCCASVTKCCARVTKCHVSVTKCCVSVTKCSDQMLCNQMLCECDQMLCVCESDQIVVAQYCWTVWYSPVFRAAISWCKDVFKDYYFAWVVIAQFAIRVRYDLPKTSNDTSPTKSLVTQ